MAATFFLIRGVAPPEVKSLPPNLRVAYWNLVVEFGLRRKDWELSRGLNAKGEPLPGVRPETRKNRKSEMTPSGKGDPRAPYLMPGRGLSRTRSLLAGKAHADYAEFGWRYSSQLGDQWGRVLAIHARRGKAYDVVGLSPRGVAWVAAQAQAKWRRILAGKEVADLTTASQAAAQGVTVPLVGRTNLDYATEGIGGTLDQARQAIAEGRSSGFLSESEWRKHFRQARPAISAAAPGASYSVRTGRSNVLLQHVFEGRDMADQLLETAVNNLVAAIEAGFGIPQIEALLGSRFAEALAEAARRGLVVIARGADGKPVFKVVRS